ncbi:MAG: hypothetical protein QOE92_800 [Chloroflexota bacterium]|nr:hypothetical protein [Chloroflexota bacterium]
MAIETTDPAEEALGALLESPQYRHLVQGFKNATGLDLHAYSLAAVPVTVPFDPPQYCQTLQSGMDCPLYFDPRYHYATAPEVRDTCGGLGHAVVPVIGPDGRQVANLVTATARFGPVDMEAITERSFKLKVFPDELAAQAEAVPMVARERLLFAAQILFAGMHELAAGRAQGAGSMELIIRHVAGASLETVPQAILDAVSEVSGAEFAYIQLLDDAGGEVAEASNLKVEEGWWRILQGTAQWAVAAGTEIEIPDVSASAWCRHLAGSTPPPAAIYGAPLTYGDRVFGALVVGGTDTSRLEEWHAALAVLAETGAGALFVARRLVEMGDGDMVDHSTGAYNTHFLEELLEKEISRAGRHHHELSVVIFRLDNYADLVTRLGDRVAQEVLSRMVEQMRSKTRKVNSLARVGEAEFALVIPEADREVAERVAEQLRTVAQASDLPGSASDPDLRLALRSRTVSNPTGVDAALQSLASRN